MGIKVEVDEALLAEEMSISALRRLMVKLQRQREVDAAFGRYRWRGNFVRSRKGRFAL